MSVKIARNKNGKSLEIAVPVVDYRFLTRDLMLPFDADKDPARYVALVDNVQTLFTTERISAKWAKIILGRRRASLGDLRLLMKVFEAGNDHVSCSMADGLAEKGGHHYYLKDADVILDKIRRTGRRLI